jgi:hypothetical protein
MLVKEVAPWTTDPIRFRLTGVNSTPAYGKYRLLRTGKLLGK